MIQNQENVANVTTKKNYVKPEFQVVEMKFEAPLLVDSDKNNASGTSESRFRTLKEW